MRAAIAVLLPAAAAALLGGCGSSGPEAGPEPVAISAPGFPPMPVPPDNPTTREGIELGRRLFFDPVLSGDGTMSCATCHDPAFAFSDHGRRVSIGIRGTAGRRNAPSLVNMGWNLAQFWEGRRVTLEEQAGDPVPAHDEMDLPWPEAIARVAARADYAPYFRAAFGSEAVSRERIVKAIAQFERTLVSVNSRYDVFVRTSQGFTAAERNGYRLFITERADCFHCHVNDTTTDFGFQNNGLDSIFADPGRAAITGADTDIGKFKTPTLRNLVFTAPYMHDGRFATLEEVVEHYHHGGKASPTVNPFIRTGNDTLQLSAQDKRDLIAFLLTMTDSSFVTNPAFRTPF